jgi:hypothetical protein
MPDSSAEQADDFQRGIACRQREKAPGYQPE